MFQYARGPAFFTFPPPLPSIQCAFGALCDKTEYLRTVTRRGSRRDRRIRRQHKSTNRTPCTLGFRDVNFILRDRVHFSTDIFPRP